MTFAEEFDELIVGKNVMTPHRIECGELHGDWLYELCEGTGMRNDAIFGVSIARRGVPHRLFTDYSGLFRSERAAREYIETVQPEMPL